MDAEEYPDLEDLPHSKKEIRQMVTYTVSPVLDEFLLTCAIFVGIVYICNLIRELILFSSLLDKFQDVHMYKLLVAEMLGTFEHAVSCYEINFIIMDAFGELVYTLSIFFVGLWQAKRAPEYEYDGNPLIVLVKYIEAVHPLRKHQFETVDPLYQKIEFIIFMIIAQAISAFTAYNVLVNIIWKNAGIWTLWEKPNYHLIRYSTQEHWRASIRGTAELAAFIEGFLSMIIYFWPFYIRFRGFRQDSAIVLIEAGKAVFARMGAHYSGSYYNPVLGFNIESHTGGPTLLTKFFVYCISPIVGTLCGIFIAGINI